MMNDGISGSWISKKGDTRYISALGELIARRLPTRGIDAVFGISDPMAEMAAGYVDSIHKVVRSEGLDPEDSDVRKGLSALDPEYAVCMRMVRGNAVKKSVILKSARLPDRVRADFSLRIAGEVMPGWYGSDIETSRMESRVREVVESATRILKAESPKERRGKFRRLDENDPSDKKRIEALEEQHPRTGWVPEGVGFYKEKGKYYTLGARPDKCANVIELVDNGTTEFRLKQAADETQYDDAGRKMYSADSNIRRHDNWYTDYEDGAIKAAYAREIRDVYCMAHNRKQASVTAVDYRSDIDLDTGEDNVSFLVDGKREVVPKRLAWASMIRREESRLRARFAEEYEKDRARKDMEALKGGDISAVMAGIWNDMYDGGLVDVKDLPDPGEGRTYLDPAVRERLFRKVLASIEDEDGVTIWNGVAGRPVFQKLMSDRLWRMYEEGLLTRDEYVELGSVRDAYTGQEGDNGIGYLLEMSSKPLKEMMDYIDRGILTYRDCRDILEDMEKNPEKWYCLKRGGMDADWERIMDITSKDVSNVSDTVVDAEVESGDGSEAGMSEPDNLRMTRYRLHLLGIDDEKPTAPEDAGSISAENIDKGNIVLMPDVLDSPDFKFVPGRVGHDIAMFNMVAGWHLGFVPEIEPRVRKFKMDSKKKGGSADGRYYGMFGTYMSHGGMIRNPMMYDYDERKVIHDYIVPLLARGYAATAPLRVFRKESDIFNMDGAPGERESYRRLMNDGVRMKFVSNMPESDEERSLFPNDSNWKECVDCNLSEAVKALAVCAMCGYVWEYGTNPLLSDEESLLGMDDGTGTKYKVAGYRDIRYKISRQNPEYVSHLMTIAGYLLNNPLIRYAVSKEMMGGGYHFEFDPKRSMTDTVLGNSGIRAGTRMWRPDNRQEDECWMNIYGAEVISALVSVLGTGQERCILTMYDGSEIALMDIIDKDRTFLEGWGEVCDSIWGLAPVPGPNPYRTGDDSYDEYRARQERDRPAKEKKYDRFRDYLKYKIACAGGESSEMYIDKMKTLKIDRPRFGYRDNASDKKSRATVRRRTRNL